MPCRSELFNPAVPDVRRSTRGSIEDSGAEELQQAMVPSHSHPTPLLTKNATKHTHKLERGCQMWRERSPPQTKREQGRFQNGYPARPPRGSSWPLSSHGRLAPDRRMPQTTANSVQDCPKMRSRTLPARWPQLLPVPRRTLQSNRFLTLCDA